MQEETTACATTWLYRYSVCFLLLHDFPYEYLDLLELLNFIGSRVVTTTTYPPL